MQNMLFINNVQILFESENIPFKIITLLQALVCKITPKTPYILSNNIKYERRPSSTKSSTE